MVRRAENDILRKKELLRGLENLVDLGGFIQDVVEESIYALYPQGVMNAVLKYYDFGNGVLEVADAVEKVWNEANNHVFNQFLEGDLSDETKYERFAEWCAEQTARIESERIRNKQESFWIRWELSRNTKRILRNLSVLEERVLFYGYGMDGHEKRSASEIAKLPEFQCEEFFIQAVLERVETLFKNSKDGQEEFDKVCDLNRQIKDKDEMIKENV